MFAEIYKLGLYEAGRELVHFLWKYAIFRMFVGWGRFGRVIAFSTSSKSWRSNQSHGLIGWALLDKWLKH